MQYEFELLDTDAVLTQRELLHTILITAEVPLCKIVGKSFYHELCHYVRL